VSFEGRVVVVSGGAHGIGDATLAAFLEQGATAVSLDVAPPDEPRPGVTYLTADVRDDSAVRDALSTLERVDVLVNNAGVQEVGLVGELSAEAWDRVLGTHLTGAFVCATHAVPRMRAQGGGAVVNIASVAAFLGLPGRGPYSAAKAALTAFTRVLAVETATAGIRVNSVAPGFTRTRLLQLALDTGALTESWTTGEVPMRRLAEPAEIARVVRFLASDDASYITGQTILVDGGWSIQGIHAAPEYLGGSGD
jgi:NAD(P)-dependent dehydrogenase (short-subunit alcohol dehydrogenase family)